MKNILVTICSVAMIGICSVGQAQDQDTTSTNLNPQPTLEQGENTQSDDMKTEDAERTDDQTQSSTDQELQNDADAIHQNFKAASIDKVGPNGEKLFIERGKYFYIDEAGKRIKVKKSEVRDKSENP